MTPENPPSAVGCIDVGGTAIKIGVLDESDTLVDERQVPTTPGRSVDGAELLDQVARIGTELRERHRIEALGVVVPGIVDEVSGTAVWAANLGWRDAAFRDPLAQRLQIPVAFGHDVRAGGLAEATLGAAATRPDTVFLPIGTGIAAAILIEGRPVAAGGWAGEIGHCDVGHGEPCACGATGCLEAIASASAIARRYHAATGAQVEGAAMVAALVESGDGAAQRVWSEAVEALGLAMSWLVGLVAPQTIVIGGGLARSGRLLLDPLTTQLSARLRFQRAPEVVAAQLGDLAGCIGAGLLARQAVSAE